MARKDEVAIAGQSFEEFKQVTKHGAEYWSARALQPLLGYSQWRRFEQAIDRAITSCKNSGNPSEHHFANAGKPITGGKGAVQVVDDTTSPVSPAISSRRTVTRASRRLLRRSNTSPFRLAVRSYPITWPPTWSDWSCVNKLQKNSRLFPARRNRPECKATCSVCSTMPDTRDCMVV